MRKEPSLAKQVMDDFVGEGRWPALLLLLIIFTSLSVVFITHETRRVVARHDALSNERSRLEVEMRNILLEEYTLSEHSRILAIASKELHMLRPDNEHEKIVSQ